MEYTQKKRNYELEITNKREMADIETGKFCQIVDSIGRETLVAISRVLLYILFIIIGWTRNES